MDCSPARFLCPWDSPGKNTGVGCYFLLQGIFPTQGSNPSLQHWGQIFDHLSHSTYPNQEEDFPGGSDGKAPAYNAGDPGSIPGSARSPGEGNGNPLQYSCLENPMDGEAW